MRPETGPDDEAPADLFAVLMPNDRPALQPIPAEPKPAEPSPAMSNASNHIADGNAGSGIVNAYALASAARAPGQKRHAFSLPPSQPEHPSESRLALSVEKPSLADEGGSDQEVVGKNTGEVSGGASPVGMVSPQVPGVDQAATIYGDGQNEPASKPASKPANRPAVDRLRRRKPTSSHELAVLSPLMTAADVAHVLGISVSTVRRRCQDNCGFPQPRRIGGLTRWVRSEIERYLGVSLADPKSGD